MEIRSKSGDKGLILIYFVLVELPIGDSASAFLEDRRAESRARVMIAGVMRGRRRV